MSEPKSNEISSSSCDTIKCPKFKHEELHEAASILDVNRIKELLLQQQDANINRADRMGRTIFYHVMNPRVERHGQILERKCLAAQLEIMRLLLESSADADQINDRLNRTELHKAARSSKLNLLKLLLEFGANAERADDEGWRPLHLACLSRKTNSFEVVEMLIDHGVDVNAQTGDDDTPLHIILRRATEPSTSRFVRLLLGAGADIFTSKPQCFRRLVSRISDPYGNQKRHQQIIYSHMICLLAAEVPIDSQNEAIMLKLLDIPRQNKRDAEKLAASRRQVAKMRAIHLDESITLHDLLFKTQTNHIHNLLMVHSLTKVNYKALSQYKLLLQGRLRRAEIHLELNEAARKRLRANNIDPHLQKLPDELLERIFDHMNVIDLRNLLICCEKLNLPRDS